ncbi:hypothetical protein AVEN_106686-1 [Araneus ventricosus]|uniref:Uncharacterized protein n=1 Tax=Araneus ventricosus TaxID=182803 RepID=A0A4Y2KE20_ARAVE|nr:hypothetical protein AVEN_106686-1 [Araneus ventricosus]
MLHSLRYSSYSLSITDLPRSVPIKGPSLIFSKKRLKPLVGKGAKKRAFQNRAADICHALVRADDVFVSLPLLLVFQRSTDPRDHIPRKFCDSLCRIFFFLSQHCHH